MGRGRWVRLDPITPMTDEPGLRAALDALVRSAQGRCINPRCPSKHVGDAQDCIDFAIRAALAATPAASDGSLDVGLLARAIHKTSGAMTKFETETEYFARWAEDIATEYDRLSESPSEGKTE